MRPGHFSDNREALWPCGVAIQNDKSLFDLLQPLLKATGFFNATQNFLSRRDGKLILAQPCPIQAALRQRKNSTPRSEARKDIIVFSARCCPAMSKALLDG